MDAEQDLATKRMISMAKGIAGLIRFLSEDVYNGICQLIYLCKIWHEEQVTSGSKAFVIASVTTGVLCSLLGPLQEALALRSMGGCCFCFGHSAPVYAHDPESQGLVSQASGSPTAGGAPDTVHKGPGLEELMFRSDCPKGRRLHGALLASAVWYWASMALIYFLVEPSCNGGVPQSAWMLYMSMTMGTTLLEVWILIHTKNGNLLFKNCGLPFILGVVFENMGRFDTFGDVTNAVLIKACSDENPAAFSWFEIHKQRFYLPADLGQMLTWGLLGIVLMQSIPGLLMLGFKKWTAIGLKLNEFCILLNAIAREAYRDEVDFDSYSAGGWTVASEKHGE